MIQIERIRIPSILLHTFKKLTATLFVDAFNIFSVLRV